MIIDHIGIVVKSIVNGITYWQEIFGYNQYTEVVDNTRQKVKVVFLKKEEGCTISVLNAVI